MNIKDIIKQLNSKIKDKKEGRFLYRENIEKTAFNAIKSFSINIYYKEPNKNANLIFTHTITKKVLTGEEDNAKDELLSSLIADIILASENCMKYGI